MSKHPDTSKGYELTDANPKGIGQFLISLVVLAVFSFLSMAGLAAFLIKHAAKGERPISLVSDARTLPPNPRLQVTPIQDLAKFKDEEKAILNSYGWVDPENKIVRVPITRAMEILAERGLPAKAKEAEAVQ